MEYQNNFIIGRNERMYIDGVELKNVEMYELRHSAGNSAELTVKLIVNVNQADSE